ncbi:MAG: asparagine synthase (glutamine-hydrolyzing), partial [Candidatus Pacebacteria bacterium]|nr:asparagine synthase (glutamine-hydrolyzing) [Candidatus Paceibacterota bacterium]
MCAINGFTFPDEELIKKMNKKTAHRGPDDSGVFLDGKVTFGHNRLSIIDPSPSAHQPMKSKDGNVVVILNGEIYNFRELKEELDSSYSFKTESDTEVIIAAWEKWGTECVKRFNGIFSLALWDKRKETLFLARDHAGIKPLYYYLDGERLIFSSEIKGILEHNIPRNIDYEALGHYFRLLYVPAPHTLFKNVLKFPPAHYAIFKEGKLEFMKYWDESENSSIKNKDELLEKTKAVITESVKRQLVSDKPLGVYLSGGLDSSIILHSMSEKHVDIDTFSVGFELSKEEQADKFNADFFLAKRTAKHYGTKHHEILLSPSDVVELF